MSEQNKMKLATAAHIRKRKQDFKIINKSIK